MICKKTLISLFTVITVMITNGLVSCRNGHEISTQKMIKAYFDKDIVKNQITNNVSAYFDLSNGIIVAYKTNPNAAAFLNNVVQQITSGDSCDVFKMSDAQITPLKEQQTQLYNTIMDASSYQMEMAPIEKTLDKIIKDNKSALLVTDFEEFTPDKRVQHQGFETRYFVNWLKAGNDITFFVFDYIEDKLPKHLYFVVFDNKEHKLLSRVKELNSGVTGYREYHLSRDAFSCETKYLSNSKGGTYHDDEGNDLVTAVLEDGSDDAFTKFGNGQRVEFYPIGDNWSNVLKNAKAMQEPGVSPKFTHLFRNLFFDFSNTDSYSIKSLYVRVTDVENDFQKYCMYYTAITDKTKEGEGYDENKNLLDEYNYPAHPGKIREINDFLTIDKKLFDETFAKSKGKRAEIGILFSPNFNGEIVGGESDDLYRVDVCIDEAIPNVGPQLDELFSWGANTSLRDAINNTLHILKPKGTVIYSYFIRAN